MMFNFCYDYKLLRIISITKLIYMNANIDIKKDFNVIELFAGAGGLALGLEQAGFNTKLAVEINKWAAKTLKTNRPYWNILEDTYQKRVII